jgi:Sec-independent protein secretion pathway component TatC
MDAASAAALLLIALTLAAQPYSVLAGVILVATKRGVVKECAYVTGWMLALSAVMVIALAMAPDTPTTSTSTTTAAVEIGLGLAFAAYLWFRWRKTSGTEAPTPSWMGRLDTMPWALALVLGAFLPNYFLVVAGATEMVQIGLTGAALVTTAVVFVLVASLGVAAPLAVLVAKRDRAPEVYAGWRTWILANNRPVMYGMGAMIAVILVGKGLWALASSG